MKNEIEYGRIWKTMKASFRSLHSRYALHPGRHFVVVNCDRKEKVEGSGKARM
jgi:hypothetical protein